MARTSGRHLYWSIAQQVAARAEGAPTGAAGLLQPAFFERGMPPFLPRVSLDPWWDRRSPLRPALPAC
jgi:hypothetical protein